MCEKTLDNRRQTWTCRIGTREGVEVPPGGDFPMRMAVKEAFRAITGEDAEACFSGWGDTFTEGELACIENRAAKHEPVSPPAIPEDVRETLKKCLDLAERTLKSNYALRVPVDKIEPLAHACAWLDSLPVQVKENGNG